MIIFCIVAVLWIGATGYTIMFNPAQFKHHISVETKPATPWYWQVCNYLVFQQFHKIVGLGSDKVTRFYHWQEPYFVPKNQIDLTKCSAVTKDSFAADYSKTGLFRNLFESVKSLRGVVVRFASKQPVQYGFMWQQADGYMIKMCTVLCPPEDQQFLFVKGGDALFIAFDTNGHQVPVILASPANTLITRDDVRYREVRKM